MIDKEDIRTIRIGERSLDLIDGLAIKKYLPDSIMDNIQIALNDRGMKWNDEVISDCTMVISYDRSVSMMYKYDARRFKGTLLYNFNLKPDHGHRFSFALKGKHIEYYMRTKFY